LGFGVWGLGFGVWGLGFGVWGYNTTPYMGLVPKGQPSVLGFALQGSGM